MKKIISLILCLMILLPMFSVLSLGTAATFAIDKAEFISFTVHHIWDDADDLYGKRPESVTVRLYADGVEIKSAILNEDNDWAYTFNGFHKEVWEVDIEIRADNADGYTSAVRGNISDGFVVTNTLILVPDTSDAAIPALIIFFTFALSLFALTLLKKQKNL